ncbi:MAG TPA: choice-of-anchor tandem repeat GloVer-containing protein [Pseudomonadales bacterium]|nr:choice-of-anchor tandem repeat GloVer-containing protein [Pseudomonadales bacterium]
MQIKRRPCSFVGGTRLSRILPALVTCLGLVFATRATAVQFTTLYSFTNGVSGGGPLTGLVISSNVLYGTTTSSAGIGSYGSVFGVKTDGTGFRNLYRFTGGNDGYRPAGGLVVSSNVLYGTAYYGGTNDSGTVFAINATSGSFTNLYSFSTLVSFTNGDGASPSAGLILSGRTLYGTTYRGGSSRYGSVFALNTDGTGFTNLHTFNHNGTEGYYLYATLLLYSNTLYGTTSAGGAGSGGGTIFSLNTNGTAFTVLYNFGTNTAGGYSPYGGLVVLSNTLYGTTQSGGSGTLGTVYAINTNGTGFTVLHNFTYADGEDCWGSLVLSGKTLFGTAYSGGTSGVGTVFALNTDGTGFTNLHNFYYATDGEEPQAGLILSGHALYGTSYSGGGGSFGTVFSLSSTPPLSISSAGSQIVLSWPGNSAGFDFSGYVLQSAASLANTFTNIAGATSPYTNTMDAPAQFFRLISN